MLCDRGGKGPLSPLNTSNLSFRHLHVGVLHAGPVVVLLVVLVLHWLCLRLWWLLSCWWLWWLLCLLWLCYTGSACGCGLAGACGPDGSGHRAWVVGGFKPPGVVGPFGLC